MTVIAFASVTGAPGVTTLACLVGATWPATRPAIVVESDPFGGDLAARFQLSTRVGWSSFVTASRRAGGRVPIDPHVQRLPGGLGVLVGQGGGEEPPSDSHVDLLVATAGSEDGVDLIVDLGRLLPGDGQHSSWARHGELLVVVLDGDPASVWVLHERLPVLRQEWGPRVALVVKAGAEYSASDIASFAGLPVVGEVPTDPPAAAIAAGRKGNSRRLSRSPLVGSASRLAQSLAGADGRSADQPPIDKGHRGLSGQLRVLGRRQRALQNPPDPTVEAIADPPAQGHVGHSQQEVAS